jgi:peptide/nickel transport system substrate-binding protein
MKITQRLRHHGAAAIGALLVVGLLASCAASAEPAQNPSADAEAPTSGGTIYIARKDQPLGYDAAFVNQVWRDVSRSLTDSLVFLNPDTGEFEPWLAKSWEVDDDRIFTFHLRDDVTFNDGTKLTGNVVKTNFERLIELKSTSGYVDGFSSITVPDENTVVIDFPQPNAAFLTGLSRAHVGIVSEASALSTVEERQQYIDGSGPFVLDTKRSVPDEQIVLIRRDDYNWAPEWFDHQGPAYADEVIYKIITEESVRVGALQSGEVDLITQTNSRFLPELQGVDGIVIPETAYGQGTGWPELPLNTSKGALTDVRVRQALQVGIDRAVLSQVGTNGTEPAAKGPLTQANPYFSDVSSQLAYDPKKSASLLDAAGWKTIGDDGIRVNSTGERLSLRYAGVESDVVLIIQDQLKQIGIDFVIDPPLAAEANAALLTGDYDIGYWTQSLADPDVLRANYSASTGSNRSFLDLSRPEDAKLDTLLQEQKATLDRDKRQKIVDQIADLLVGQAFTLPTLQNVDVWAHTERLHDVKFNGVDQLLYDAWVSEK